jgi:hypothetical protein
MNFHEQLERAKGFIVNTEDPLTCSSPGVDKLLIAIHSGDTPAGRLALSACEREIVDAMREGCPFPAKVKNLDDFHEFVETIHEQPPEELTEKMIKIIQKM